MRALVLNWFQEDDKPFQVRLSDESFETYELDPPPYTLNTTKKELKRMYYDMVSIRYFDFHYRREKWRQADKTRQADGDGSG